MASVFALALQNCGLDMNEGAAFLNIPFDTAISWYLGQRETPEEMIDKLIDLSTRQDVAAQETALLIKSQIEKHGLPEILEIGISADDFEAKSLGWPCANAHAAVFARLIKLLPKDTAKKLQIVPRGSTVGTALASDVHNPFLK